MEHFDGFTEEETEEIIKETELIRLKEEIASYDYIGVKIAMGVATIDEYSEQIAYTEQLRAQIRELEGE